MPQSYTAIPVHKVNLGAGISAFFTQTQGGVSPQPWASLNLGLNVTDSVERVLANRNLVAARTGKPIRFADQVHSNEVLTLSGGPAQSEASCGTADGLVTASDHFALGVLVADCVPVLLADPVARVVGTAHAGRAGLLSGVLAQAVVAMQEAGAQRESLQVAVGPCICAGCYEVPESMAANFVEATGVTVSQTSWGTPSLDLRQAASLQLSRLGITRVTHLTQCTRENEAFFSHRRAMARQQTTGRFAGIISLK